MVIPASLRRKNLKLLHSNHTGMVKMKQQARRNVYWFGINKDIESDVNHCDICMKMAVVPGQNVTSEWVPTTRPFSRIHAVFFYFERQTCLLIVDSFSE